MNTAAMQESITIKPRAQLRTPPEFKIRIMLNSITHNETVSEFIRPKAEFQYQPCDIPAQKKRYNELQRRDVEKKFMVYNERTAERADRFDVVIATQWNKNSPLSPVPNIDVQHKARIIQLQDMDIPEIGKEYFFKDKTDFNIDMAKAWIDLNDFEGDLLTTRYVQYSYEPIAVMTDYQGAISNDKSYSKDKALIEGVLTDYNDTIKAIIRTRSPMNYIGIIFRSTTCEYESYQHYVLNTPRTNPDVKYVRYSLLI